MKNIPIDIKANTQKCNSRIIKKTLFLQDSPKDFNDILKNNRSFFKQIGTNKCVVDVKDFLKKDSKSNSKTKKSNSDIEDVCIVSSQLMFQNEAASKTTIFPHEFATSNSLNLSDVSLNKSDDVEIPLDVNVKEKLDNGFINRPFGSKIKKSVNLLNASLLDKKLAIRPNQYDNPTKLDLLKNINNDLGGLQTNSNDDTNTSLVKDSAIKTSIAHNSFLDNKHSNEPIKFSSLSSGKNFENKINKLVKYVSQMSTSSKSSLGVRNDNLSPNQKVDDKVNKVPQKTSSNVAIKSNQGKDPLVSHTAHKINKINKKNDYFEKSNSEVDRLKTKESVVGREFKPLKVVSHDLSNNKDRSTKTDISYDKHSKDFLALRKSESNKEMFAEKNNDKKEPVSDKPVSLNVKKQKHNLNFIPLNTPSSFPLIKQASSDKVANVTPLNHIADMKFTNIKFNGVLQHMDIVLKPDGLGKVTAKMQFHDDKLVVEIKAENKETARLLSLNEKILKDNIFKDNISSNKDVHIVITTKDEIKSMSEMRQENNSSFNNNNRSQQFAQDFSGSNPQADHTDRRFSKKTSYLDSNEGISGLNGNIDEDNFKASSDHLLII